MPGVGTPRRLGSQDPSFRRQEMTVTTTSLPTSSIGTAAGLSVRPDGDLLVVALRGSIDIYSVPGLRPALERLADGGDLVVDLSEVTLIDSSGLGALMRLRNRSRRAGTGRFGLVCPRRRLRRVFDLTGLRSEFVIGPDLATLRQMWETPG